MNQVSTWFFTTFSVSGLKDKVHHVDSLHQLFSAISPEQIDFPPFVLEYDARVSAGARPSPCGALPLLRGGTWQHSVLSSWADVHVISALS